MATLTVSIKSMKFNPASLAVKAGDSVVWKNDDRMTHTATADNGPVPDTGEIPSGKTSSPQVFAAAGKYKYHCEIHPDMTGEVVAS